MPCLICSSGNQTEFTAEINIHFSGRENIDHPGVMIFPKILICLDCGSSNFSTPQAELSQLTRRRPACASALTGTVDGAIFRHRLSLGA
jgi:hypothetical protein